MKSLLNKCIFKVRGRGKDPRTGRPEQTFHKGFRMISALVAYSIFVSALLPFQLLQAQGAPVPGLNPSTFDQTKLQPDFSRAERSRNAAAWENLIEGSLSVLRANWEASVDAEINILVNAVNTRDSFNSVSEYRDYVRKSLEVQKEKSMADWELSADLSIREERETFLTALGDKKLEETRTETRETLQDNQDKVSESCPDGGCDLNTDAMSRSEADSYINQAWDQAALDLSSEKKDWEVDILTRMGDGQRQFRTAKSALDLNYAVFLKELGEAKNEFDGNLKVIRTYEQRVRDGIAATVGNMDTYLASNGLFYKETCDAKNRCSTNMNQLNSAGLEYNNLLKSLKSGLNSGAPLSTLAAQMQSYMEAQKTRAQTRQTFYEGITRGTETYSTGINVAPQGRDKYAKHKSNDRQDHPPSAGVIAKHTFGKIDCTLEDIGRGKPIQTCSGGQFVLTMGSNAMTYRYAKPGLGAGFGTKSLGQLGDKSTWDLTDQNGNPISGLNMSELLKFHDVQAIIQYQSTKDASLLDNLLNRAGETREITGVSSADICGASAGGKDWSHTCYSDQGSSAFAYTETKWKGGTKRYNKYYAYTETSLNEEIDYNWYDKHADQNAGTWKGYVNNLDPFLSGWAKNIMPAIQNWEEQRSEYQRSYAQWQVDATAQKNQARSAYVTGIENLRKEKVSWERNIKDEFDQGRKKWKLLTKQLEDGRDSQITQAGEYYEGNKRVSSKLGQLTKSAIANVLKNVPQTKTAGPKVKAILDTAAAAMPKLGKEFLEAGRKNLPDIQDLSRVAAEFQKSLSGAMNLATVGAMDIAAENKRSKTIQMISQSFKDQGYSVKTLDNGNVQAVREIYSGLAHKKPGAKGMSPEDYSPHMTDQTVEISAPEVVAMAKTENIFSDWNNQKVMSDFAKNMQANVQAEQVKFQGVDREQRYANEYSVGKQKEYQSEVQRAIESEMNKEKRKGVVASVIKTVVSIVASMFLGPMAMMLLSAAMGAAEGGLKGAVAGAISSFTQQYGFSLSYSKDGGFGASYGYGPVAVGYSESGGASVGLNFGKSSGMQAGISYSQSGGFGAKVGYAAGNGAETGLNYSKDGGVGVYADYSTPNEDGANLPSHNLSVGYNKGGLRASYDYNKATESHGILDVASSYGIGISRDGLDLRSSTGYVLNTGARNGTSGFKAVNVNSSGNMHIGRDGSVVVTSSSKLGAEYQSGQRPNGEKRGFWDTVLGETSDFFGAAGELAGTVGDFALDTGRGLMNTWGTNLQRVGNFFSADHEGKRWNYETNVERDERQMTFIQAKVNSQGVAGLSLSEKDFLLDKVDERVRNPLDRALAKGRLGFESDDLSLQEQIALELHNANRIELDIPGPVLPGIPDTAINAPANQEQTGPSVEQMSEERLAELKALAANNEQEPAAGNPVPEDTTPAPLPATGNANVVAANSNPDTGLQSAFLETFSDMASSLKAEVTALAESAVEGSKADFLKLSASLDQAMANPSLDNISKLVDMVQENMVLDTAIGAIPLVADAWDVVVTGNDIAKGDYEMAAVAGIATIIPFVGAGKAKRLYKKFQDSDLAGDLGNSISNKADDVWGWFTKKSPDSSVAGMNPCKRCFAAGTKVSTPRGFRNIEELQVGDSVIAWDLKNDRAVSRKVIGLHRNTTLVWHEVSMAGQTLTVTGNHRFWNAANDEWLPVSEMKAGMQLMHSSRKLTPVQDIRIRNLTRPDKIYNLEVEEHHNYFAGLNPVLVHNGGTGDCDKTKIGQSFVRSEAELDSLATDPAIGQKVTNKTKMEREAGLGVEANGSVPGPIVRDSTGAAEFIDATGQKWDVKTFNSHYPERKGGYTLEKSMDEIRNSLSKNENVILDTRNLKAEHAAELKAEIIKQNLKDLVVDWQP